MYSCFNMVQVVDRDAGSGKLECLDFWENNLYIGTSTGEILLYHIEESTNPHGEPVTSGILECQNRVGPKKPVEQIAVVAELGFLIVLCDQNITIHDLASLDITDTLTAAKGASLFCTNKCGAMYRLAVCIKKKLHMFEFIGEYVHAKDQLLPDIACVMLWHQNNICVGYKREYTLMHDETGDVLELFSLDSRTSKPLIKLLPMEELLLGSDDLGVVLDFTALPTRSGIRWSNPPLALGESFPYVVVLQQKCIEVYNVYDQQLVQTIPFAGGVSLVDDGNKLFVCSQARVAVLNPVPFQDQIAELMRTVRVEAALDLFERTTEDNAELPAKTALVHEDAAFVQICALEFEDARTHLKQTRMDPCQILCYFNGLVPEDLGFKPKTRGHAPDIQAVVTKAVRETNAVSASEEEMLVQLHTEEAKSCVVDYLVWAREQPENAKRLDIIDTAMVKLLVELGAAKSSALTLTDFLAGDNKAELDQLEDYLVASKQFNALALMYKQFGMDVKALDIWAKLGSGSLKEANQDGISETVKFLSDHKSHELIWNYSRWVLDQKPDQGLKIFTVLGRENPLPPAKVVEFLSGFSDSLYQAYLEHLIHVEETTVHVFHTQLALHYADTILTLMPTTEDDAPRVKAGSEAGLLGQVRTKLLDFLEMSSLVDFDAVIRRTDDTSLYEERVVLFKKVKDHATATHILVYKLADLEWAERYCVTLDAEFGTVEEALLTLLTTLLHPHPAYSEEVQEEASIYILNKFAQQLDALRVMAILPESLTIASLSEYLHQVTRATYHRYRDGQVVKNVAKMNNFQTKCDLCAHRMNHVRITKDRNCPLCAKRISDKVFAATPDLQVIHFKCFKDRGSDLNELKLTKK